MLTCMIFMYSKRNKAQINIENELPMLHQTQYFYRTLKIHLMCFMHN